MHNMIAHTLDRSKVLLLIFLLIISASTHSKTSAIRRQFGESFHGRRESIGKCKNNNALLFSFRKSAHPNPDVYEIQILKTENDAILMGIQTKYGEFIDGKPSSKADSTSFAIDSRPLLHRILSQFKNYKQDSTEFSWLDGPEFTYCFCGHSKESKIETRSYSIHYGSIQKDVQFSKAFSDSILVILSPFEEKLKIMKFMTHIEKTTVRPEPLILKHE